MKAFVNCNFDAKLLHFLYIAAILSVKDCNSCQTIMVLWEKKNGTIVARLGKYY